MNQAQRMLALAAAFQLLSAAAWAVDAPPPAPAPTLVRVKIVAFNDSHGNLESPGTFGENTTVPSAQRPAVGGAEYLAAYIATMKAGNPNTVVLGGGDFVGATPLISALFYDEPAVEALNKIGVDFSAVGNHEFDKGSAAYKGAANAYNPAAAVLSKLRVSTVALP